MSNRKIKNYQNIFFINKKVWKIKNIIPHEEKREHVLFLIIFCHVTKRTCKAAKKLYNFHLRVLSYKTMIIYNFS